MMLVMQIWYQEHPEGVALNFHRVHLSLLGRSALYECIKKMDHYSRESNFLGFSELIKLCWKDVQRKLRLSIFRDNYQKCSINNRSMRITLYLFLSRTQEHPDTVNVTNNSPVDGVSEGIIKFSRNINNT